MDGQAQAADIAVVEIVVGYEGRRMKSQAVKTAGFKREIRGVLGGPPFPPRKGKRYGPLERPAFRPVRLNVQAEFGAIVKGRKKIQMHRSGRDPDIGERERECVDEERRGRTEVARTRPRSS